MKTSKIIRVPFVAILEPFALLLTWQKLFGSLEYFYNKSGCKQ